MFSFTVNFLTKTAVYLRKSVERPCVRRLDSRSDFKFSAITRLLSQDAIQQEEIENDVVSNNSESDDEASGDGGILYEQKELETYHRILERLPSYQNTVFSKRHLHALVDPFNSKQYLEMEKRDWSAASDAEVLQAFHYASSHAVAENVCISDERFTPLCSALKDRLQNFSDESLIDFGKLLALWPPAENTYAPNFAPLFKALDQVSTDRYLNWYRSRNMSVILRMGDVWYWLRLGKLNHFLRASVFHCLGKVKEPSHAIQMMLSLAIMRSPPMSYKAYDMEKKLYGFKNSYTLDELGCAVYGIFRSRSRLQHMPLVVFTFKRILQEAEIIDPIVLSGLCKALKLSLPFECRPALLMLQAKLLSRVPDLPVQTISSVLWLCFHNHTTNDDFLRACLDKIVNRTPKVRLKELTRLLNICCELNPKGVDLKELGEKVLVEMRKRENVKWIALKDSLFGSALHRLLMCGVFPQDLVDGFLGSRSTASNSICALGLDTHIEVFYPKYDGARLSPELREETFTQRFLMREGDTYVNQFNRVGKASQFNNKLIDQMEDVLLLMLEGRQDKMLRTHIVPSSGYSDVIVCINKEGKFLPVPDDLRQLKPWELKRVPQNYLDSGVHFIALMFIWDSYTFVQRKLVCLNSERQKILKHLEFIVVEVHVSNFKQYTSSIQANKLLNKIQKSLPN